MWSKCRTSDYKPPYNQYISWCPPCQNTFSPLDGVKVPEAVGQMFPPFCCTLCCLGHSRPPHPSPPLPLTTSSSFQNLKSGKKWAISTFTSPSGDHPPPLRLCPMRMWKRLSLIFKCSPPKSATTAWPSSYRRILWLCRETLFLDHCTTLNRTDYAIGSGLLAASYYP